MAEFADHPHLYFRAEDMPAIVRKTTHPRFEQDWLTLLASAEKDLKGPLIDEGHPPVTLSRAAGRAARCAFVYRIGGQRRFAERALRLMDAVADRGEQWHMEEVPGLPVAFHLRTAAICRGLALAYDMLADEMPADKRRRFVDVCMEHAVQIFLDDCKVPTNPYLYGRRAMNWLSVIASGGGCLMIALDGDGVELSREIEIARAHALRFIEWYDDAGCATEHGHYWGFGMGQCVYFLAALRANGWADIFQQRSRKLDRVAYPTMCLNIGGVNAGNFGDDQRSGISGRAAVLILADEFRDERLQWWAQHLPSWQGEPVVLIFGDTDLPATPPDDLPTCAVFDGCGIGVMRSSMTDDDCLFLAVKAGRARGKIYDDPHCHFDLNAVVLEAFGQPLLINPGYGHNWANPTHSTTDHDHPYNGPAAHNTMLVDGRGALAENSPLAHLQDLSPDDEIDYIVSRIESGYDPKVLRFDRHAYMIAGRICVLLDDVELSSEGDLTWNFHAAAEAELAAAAGGVIVNGCARLEIIPFGDVEVAAGSPDDHVLQRIGFDTRKPVTKARAGWLLWPTRSDQPGDPPQAHLEDGAIRLTHNDRQWTLPIVPRRNSYRSAMNLIPELAARTDGIVRQ